MKKAFYVTVVVLILTTFAGVLGYQLTYGDDKAPVDSIDTLTVDSIACDSVAVDSIYVE